MDELLNTGGFRLLEPRLREAFLTYHRSVDNARALLAARGTGYAARVYELTPREPYHDSSDRLVNARVREGLTAADREGLARRAVEANLAGLLIAERNVGQLCEQTARELFVLASELVDLIRVGGAL